MIGIRFFPDGREICETEEAWQGRRRQVWVRDGGRCQCTKDCEAHVGRKCNMLLAPTMATSIETNLPVAHIHHIIERGLGGGTRDDRQENLMTECGTCHQGDKE